MVTTLSYILYVSRAAIETCSVEEYSAGAGSKYSLTVRGPSQEPHPSLVRAQENCHSQGPPWCLLLSATYTTSFTYLNHPDDIHRVREMSRNPYPDPTRRWGEAEAGDTMDMGDVRQELYGVERTLSYESVQPPRGGELGQGRPSHARSPNSTSSPQDTLYWSASQPGYGNSPPFGSDNSQLRSPPTQLYRNNSAMDTEMTSGGNTGVENNPHHPIGFIPMQTSHMRTHLRRDSVTSYLGVAGWIPDTIEEHQQLTSFPRSNSIFGDSYSPPSSPAPSTASLSSTATHASLAVHSDPVSDRGPLDYPPTSLVHNRPDETLNLDPPNPTTERRQRQRQTQEYAQDGSNGYYLSSSHHRRSSSSATSSTLRQGANPSNRLTIVHQDRGDSFDISPTDDLLFPFDSEGLDAQDDGIQSPTSSGHRRNSHNSNGDGHKHKHKHKHRHSKR